MFGMQFRIEGMLAFKYSMYKSNFFLDGVVYREPKAHLFRYVVLNI